MKEIRREEIFGKYYNQCAYCGCKIKIDNFEIDHLIPKHKGGTDDYENLMPSCRSCNRQKKTYDLETWREILQNKITELNRDNASYRTAKKFGLIEETGIEIEFCFETIY